VFDRRERPLERGKRKCVFIIFHIEWKIINAAFTNAAHANKYVSCVSDFFGVEPQKFEATMANVAPTTNYIGVG